MKKNFFHRIGAENAKVAKETDSIEKRCGPLRLSAAAVSVFWLVGCAVGPDYERPALNLPESFKEAGDWKPATPQDEQPRSEWWRAYGDPTLDALIVRLAVDNQTIKQAEAAYRQASAALDATRAGFFPNLTANVGNSRGRGAAGGTTGTAASSATGIRETDKLTLSSAWEIDVWGRIRRNVEAGDASAAASAADLRAALLSAQATLTQSWFQRQTNARQRQLLESTVAAYRRSLGIVRNRFEAGTVGRADVLQAESQLKSGEAQLAEIRLSGAQIEHAIAVLLGQPPAKLSLPEAAPRLPALPALPSLLPATLLERRPDIAAAERRVAAANAQIGVGQAAFFPALTFSAAGGYQNASFTGLIAAPNRFWSFGPALALTLFDSGARSAQKAQATAGWEKTVAAYRQTVLTAFQEVEDNLAALRWLGEMEAHQQAAAAAAKEAQRIVENQYDAGVVPYLNVLTAQTAAYTAERALLDVQNRRLQASVALNKALGGSWQP
mgnify:CR=1 FL=1